MNKYLSIALLPVLAALSVFNCAVRTYQSYPSPVPVPPRTGNSLYGVLGLPYQLEYQHRLGESRWDVIGGGAVVTSTYDDSMDTGTEIIVEERDEMNSALFGGIRFWATNPDKNGPGLHLYTGINTGINHDTETWVQVGAEAGLCPGIYLKNVILALPLKIGYGLNEGGEYAHTGAEGHLLVRSGRMTGGAKLGVVYGIGAKHDALLIHIPIGIGLYFGYDL